MELISFKVLLRMTTVCVILSMFSVTPCWAISDELGNGITPELIAEVARNIRWEYKPQNPVECDGNIIDDVAGALAGVGVTAFELVCDSGEVVVTTAGGIALTAGIVAILGPPAIVNVCGCSLDLWE